MSLLNPVVQMLVVGAATFLASSGGFWVYLRRKFEREDSIKDLIMGLAHDKITHLGIKHIEKGYITKDEYDDLFKYFWEPYCRLGGNGSAERIVQIVKLLPLRPEYRQYPAVREAVDKLTKGTNDLIDKVNEGDTDFERNPRNTTFSDPGE